MLSKREKKMRDYAVEIKNRTEFIKRAVEEAHASGIVYGNSGGKDSALVGILCKMACDNTVGIIMPCASKVNFGSDMEDGIKVADQFSIETRTVDLTGARQALMDAIGDDLNRSAVTNIAPRLRMTTLYAIGADENRIVAGTGNAAERYMGYFTKWGDGGCDFNPIADLAVAEVYEFLRYLGAPGSIISKAPSAGLFEGQTDESEMGVTYAAVDTFRLGGKVSDEERAVIERYHANSQHKRRLPKLYGEEEQA